MISCQKENFEIENLNNNTISIIGHGGMGDSHSYPMNTFESVMNCISLGANGAELDVQMTLDSILVAYHFEYLESATNLKGQIYEKTWDEIRNGRYDGLPYDSFRILKLDDLFGNLSINEDHSFFLDVKNYDTDTSSLYVNCLTNAITALVDKHDLSKNVCVELKRQDLIISLKSKNPEIKSLLPPVLNMLYSLPIFMIYMDLSYQLISFLRRMLSRHIIVEEG
jgi:glycerophosphoryl diester phosphodiesterase